MDFSGIVSRRDYVYFAAGALLIAIGFLLMALDPVENGFGVTTLWIAPPLLLTGFALPVFGLVGRIGPLPLRQWFAARQLGGYAIFVVAFIVYILTLEPTASLWDCSEFIACAYKLQVPHTPGTPLSLLIGRMFTMLASDTTRVAYALNLMSAVFSALTVGIVYHLIYYLGKAPQVDRILRVRSRRRMRSGAPAQDGPASEGVAMIASFAGALVLAFSDTFWFSAVEAETYGLACFFLMVLVWLIITGSGLEGPERNRRLVLIFYVAGLAYCIHPMCLLALTVLPFAWATHGKPMNLKIVVFSAAGGLAIVFGINKLIAIGLFELAFSLDRIAVNSLSMPFYSGIAFLAILITVAFRMAMRYQKLRPYAMAIVFLLAGFLPYVLLFIRSNHNPPIDETNPENLALIKAYMNRESYPSAPLLYGPYFDARIVDVDVRKTIYHKSGNVYNVSGTLPEYKYDGRQTLLPRLYSHDENHVQAYRSWLGLKEHERPGFVDNLKFMFTYQLGHMYFRYLFWNFAGRTGDEQNSGWLKPWQTTDALPFERARNQYWMIPLIVGIAGAVFQFHRNRRQFGSVMILFLITGAVLALYLNSPPVEPRERDYIYVGSFIAFSIWVGLGFLALASISRFWGMMAAFVAVGVSLWMLIQNYDDHDRSGRTFQVDQARTVLGSCAPNSILFTGGDNDTFPLWFLQEVEGFRTDVRVMVLSYMNTDWYINQLRKTYYNSGAFKLTLDEDDYRQYGANDVLYVQETVKSGIDFRQYLGLLKQKHPALRLVSSTGDPYSVLPSRTVYVPGKDPQSKEEGMAIRIEGGYMSKNLLAILDLVVSNNWERPVYFNYTSLNGLDADLSRYVIQEGPVFRLRPEVNTDEAMAIDKELTYRNLVSNADYSNLTDPDVHFSYEDHFARIIVPLRQAFNDLAAAYLRDGDTAMARDVMKHAIEKLYPSHLRPSYTNIAAAEMLLALGEDADAEVLSRGLYEYYRQRMALYEREGQHPTQLEVYLVRRASELLAAGR